MTDTGQTPGARRDLKNRTTSDDNVRRRYRRERRFKLIGQLALASALGMLVFLLVTIVGNGYSGFFQHEIALKVDLDPTRLDLGDKRDGESLARASYGAAIKEALRAEFPDVKGRTDRRDLNKLVSKDADIAVRDAVVANPEIVGTTQTIWVKASDDVDTFLKGHMSAVERWSPDVTAALALEGDRVTITAATSAFRGVQVGGAGGPSYLVHLNGGVVKLLEVSGGVAEAEILVAPRDMALAPAGAWHISAYATPESDRRLNDKAIAWITKLQAEDRVENRFNISFFQTGASTAPESAGIWSAVVGSFLTLVVTLAISFPIGVLAAIYLEEFAPKNRWTDVIEVNINNLAAVPSIIFGLLGLAVFRSLFGLPRSAPVVGGMVLALMTLPTIIIASRAALKAVPPSIRQAALGMGASRLQTVTHHVLPLAMPGILTGTIIGMAQALGETAPLLMIGMVAFIVDIPGGFTDSATVLPVQIYLWADSPERAFLAKTSAAIMVLLAFLILMNALAVLLRKRFERRW
jgi:phosphate transport system permease protein